MMALTFLVGLILGFVGSIPIAGPTSVIVLKNTLEKGNREGLDIAAGAGVAEAIYAFFAFWGLTEAPCISRGSSTLPASWAPC